VRGELPLMPARTTRALQDARDVSCVDALRA